MSGEGQNTLRRFLSMCPLHDSFYRWVWLLTGRLFDWIGCRLIVNKLFAEPSARYLFPKHHRGVPCNLLLHSTLNYWAMRGFLVQLSVVNWSILKPVANLWSLPRLLYQIVNRQHPCTGTDLHLLLEFWRQKAGFLFLQQMMMDECREGGHLGGQLFTL